MRIIINRNQTLDSSNPDDVKPIIEKIYSFLVAIDQMKVSHVCLNNFDTNNMGHESQVLQVANELSDAYECKNTDAIRVHILDTMLDYRGYRSNYNEDMHRALQIIVNDPCDDYRSETRSQLYRKLSIAGMVKRIIEDKSDNAFHEGVSDLMLSLKEVLSNHKLKLPDSPEDKKYEHTLAEYLKIVILELYELLINNKHNDKILSTEFVMNKLLPYVNKNSSFQIYVIGKLQHTLLSAEKEKRSSSLNRYGEFIGDNLKYILSDKMPLVHEVYTYVFNNVDVLSNQNPHDVGVLKVLGSLYLSLYASEYQYDDSEGYTVCKQIRITPYRLNNNSVLTLACDVSGKSFEYLKINDYYWMSSREDMNDNVIGALRLIAQYVTNNEAWVHDPILTGYINILSSILLDAPDISKVESNYAIASMMANKHLAVASVMEEINKNSIYSQLAHDKHVCSSTPVFTDSKELLCSKSTEAVNALVHSDKSPYGMHTRNVRHYAYARGVQYEIYTGRRLSDTGHVRKDYQAREIVSLYRIILDRYAPPTMLQHANVVTPESYMLVCDGVLKKTLNLTHSSSFAEYANIGKLLSNDSSFTHNDPFLDSMRIYLNSEKSDNKLDYTPVLDTLPHVKNKFKELYTIDEECYAGHYTGMYGHSSEYYLSEMAMLIREIEIYHETMTPEHVRNTLSKLVIAYIYADAVISNKIHTYTRFRPDYGSFDIDIVALRICSPYLGMKSPHRGTLNIELAKELAEVYNTLLPYADATCESKISNMEYPTPSHEITEASIRDDDYDEYREYSSVNKCVDDMLQECHVRLKALDNFNEGIIHLSNKKEHRVDVDKLKMFIHGTMAALRMRTSFEAKYIKASTNLDKDSFKQTVGYNNPMLRTQHTLEEFREECSSYEWQMRIRMKFIHYAYKFITNIVEYHSKGLGL